MARYAKIILSLAFLLFLTPAKAESLAELEKIAQEAGDAETLFSNPAYFNRYAQALQQYQGHSRLPLTSIQVIRQQTTNLLRDSSTVYPGLVKSRLDRPSPGEAFEIKVNETIPEFQMNVAVWNHYFTDEKYKWRVLADEFLKIEDVKARRAEVELVLREAAAAIDSLESKLAATNQDPGTQAKVKTARNAFYDALGSGDNAYYPAASRFRSALAYLLLEQVAVEVVDETLRSGDAGVVLDTMAGLARVPQQFDWATIADVPPESFPFFIT